MTKNELLEAGFKEFPSTGSNLQPWDVLFQKRIRDENGTRYFIEVMFWQHSQFGGHDSFSAEVNYNYGCAFHPQGRAFMKINANGVSDWTVDDVIRWADELWSRLCPNYYERTK